MPSEIIWLFFTDFFCLRSGDIPPHLQPGNVGHQYFRNQSCRCPPYPPQLLRSFDMEYHHQRLHAPRHFLQILRVCLSVWDLEEVLQAQARLLNIARPDCWKSWLLESLLLERVMKLKVLYERTMFGTLDKLFILIQFVEILKFLRHVGTHAIFWSTSLIWIILNYVNILYVIFCLSYEQTINCVLPCTKHL